jgi:hypothetical protein
MHQVHGACTVHLVHYPLSSVRSSPYIGSSPGARCTLSLRSLQMSMHFFMHFAICVGA